MQRELLFHTHLMCLNRFNAYMQFARIALCSSTARDKKNPCGDARRLIASVGWPVLGIIHDGLWCGFVQFKLCAHLLDLRGLVLELGNHDLHFALELDDARLLFLNFLL